MVRASAPTFCAIRQNECKQAGHDGRQFASLLWGVESRFKQEIQSRGDRYDTTWLFEGGRQWALFLARQIKDKTGNAAAKKKALEREHNPKANSNYVPTSCDDYTDEALHKWFEERDFATTLMLSLNKNRLAYIARKQLL